MTPTWNTYQEMVQHHVGFSKLNPLICRPYFLKFSCGKKFKFANILALEQYGTATESERWDNYKRIFSEGIEPRHTFYYIMPGSVQWFKIVDSMISLTIIREIWLITSSSFNQKWKHTILYNMDVYISEVVDTSRSSSIWLRKEGSTPEIKA